jgi:hypothetical protein
LALGKCATTSIHNSKILFYNWSSPPQLILDLDSSLSFPLSHNVSPPIDPDPAMSRRRARSTSRRRARDNRGDAQGLPRQHWGTSRGFADAAHSPQAATTSLPWPQHAWTILQCGRPSFTTHPRHQGNAQSLYTLGGPFIVMEVIGPANYRLQWADGQGAPNVWNIEYLCRFYP